MKQFNRKNLVPLMFGMGMMALATPQAASAEVYGTYTYNGYTVTYGSSSAGFYADITNSNGTSLNTIYPGGDYINISGSVYTGSTLQTIASGCTYNINTAQFSAACGSDVQSAYTTSSSTSSGTAGTVTSSSDSYKETSYSITAAPQQRAQTQAQVAQVSTRVANILRPSAFSKKKTAALQNNELGMASGEPAANRVGVWGNVRHVNSESTVAGGLFDGRSNNWLIGGDIRPLASLLVGLTVSQDYANYALPTSNRDSLATSVTPYVGYLFSNYFSMDALLGYSWLNNSQDTVNNAVLLGSFDDARRKFGSVSANGYLPLGSDWLLSGKLGYLYSHEKPKTQNALKLGQASLGLELSYLTPMFEPYLGATYTYDTTAPKTIAVTGTTATTDRDDVRLVGGVRANLADNLKADVSVESVQWRQKYEETSVSGNVRYEF